MSIASICPEVMEHILFSDIMQHLNKNPILMGAQHGFRKKHTCDTQIITIIEDMACNLSNSTQIDAVFLDIVKAFDKVPHQRLLLKLECNGIRRITLQRMDSFLINRKQCVIMGGVVLCGACDFCGSTRYSAWSVAFSYLY